MECEITVSGSVMKAALSGEIDHHSVRDVRERIDMELDINRPKTLFLDFGKITFMDASGIGLGLGRCRKTQLYGGKVEILNPSPQIKKVMKLSGLERLAVIDAKSNEKDGANNEG